MCNVDPIKLIFNFSKYGWHVWLWKKKNASSERFKLQSTTTYLDYADYLINFES